MLARLQKAIEDRPVVVGLGVLSIGAVGYIAYKVSAPKGVVVHVLASKFLSFGWCTSSPGFTHALVLLRSQLAFPPRAFKDVEFDDCPDNLRDLAQAIHDAGAEDLFFQVSCHCFPRPARYILSDGGTPLHNLF